MAKGLGLGLDRVAHATSKGLQLNPGLPFLTWQRLGHQLKVISTASCWWVGDWLLYGERRYGTSYREAEQIFGLGYQTLRNYAWVAGRFSLPRRRDKLSFQHHADVASLPQARQEFWLCEAEANGWSRSELRRRLRAASEEGQSGKQDREESMVLEIAVSVEQARRWRKAAENRATDLAQWIMDAADRAAEIVLEAPVLREAI